MTDTKPTAQKTEREEAIAARIEHYGVEYDVYRDEDECDAEYTERIMSILEEMERKVTALDELRDLYIEIT